MNHAIKALLLGLCCALPVLVSAADEDPDQAAAQLLEEIVASLRAQSATPPL